MENKKRYKLKSLQAAGRKLPALQFFVLWLAFDRFHAPEWLWGIYYFMAFIVLCLFIYDIATVDEVSVDLKDLFNEPKIIPDEMLKEYFKKYNS